MKKRTMKFAAILLAAVILLAVGVHRWRGGRQV